jgi:hypothetical protein
MILLIISIPLMLLGIAMAIIPLIVAMIGDEKERKRSNAGVTLARVPGARPANVPEKADDRGDERVVPHGPIDHIPIYRVRA